MTFSNKTKNRLRDRYHEWVLITGASSGIGKQLALDFAELGFKVILTGRTESALQELKNAIQNQFQTECKILSGDLSKKEDLTILLQEAANLPIGITILNAGFGASGEFMKGDLEEEIKLLDLNCKAVLIMAHFFANKMSKQAKKGAILFMSSMVAFQGVPFAANYAASKAYVQSLGEALAIELKEEGIDVLTIAPGPVASGFGERANMKMGMSLKPTQISKPIIKSIGRKSKLLPGLLTKFLIYNLNMTPRWAKVQIMGKIMGGFTKHQRD